LLLVLRAASPVERTAKLNVLTTSAEKLKAEAPGNPRVLCAYAHSMLRRGNFPAAAAACASAREKGDHRPELAAVLSQMTEPLALVDLRPRQNAWFGRRPLIGATLSAPHNPGQLQGVLSFDGRKLTDRLSGDQLLALLEEKELSGGAHQIEIRAADVYGNQATKRFDFFVDGVPPRVDVTPPEAEPVSGPLPVWTFRLSDEGSGVNLTSVRVELQSVGEGATPCRLQLVARGLYQRGLPELGVRQNDPLPGETFKVSSGLALAPGSYTLRMFFTDKAGNRGDTTRVYRVGK
jgi:hypothetical protein